MRAPSKRRIIVAGILVISLASVAWSFSQFVLRTGDFKGAPALTRKNAGGRGQAAASTTDAANPNVAAATSRVLDSDNDGIPDVAELRTFQDRDSFRRWFTAIAEIQFYQPSNQWNEEQRDCAGLPIRWS